ncbi:hypothetical protein [Paracoccus mutanolyticus]|uniref:hypothetical protein n=1 Tax=Paracoccus mutanolyticus TaxID=1499308 RepID=UPI001CB9456B|nr:hypothetical protein [Paracoccus mutanolyticus]
MTPPERQRWGSGISPGGCRAPCATTEGTVLGHVRQGKTGWCELGTEGRDFADWLVDHLDEVHRNWLQLAEKPKLIAGRTA